MHDTKDVQCSPAGPIKGCCVSLDPPHLKQNVDGALQRHPPLCSTLHACKCCMPLATPSQMASSCRRGRLAPAGECMRWYREPLHVGEEARGYQLRGGEAGRFEMLQSTHNPG